jgi:hypothetical protein
MRENAISPGESLAAPGEILFRRPLERAIRIRSSFRLFALAFDRF